MNFLQDTTVGIIIPARLDSTRLDKKLLIEVDGIPMIEHVRRRALLNSFQVPVVVASGDREILDLTEYFGGHALRTFDNHENGLSRVGEADRTLNWSRYIVLQGDEILVDPRDLNEMIRLNINDQDYSAFNMVTSLKDENQLINPSVVKCVLNQHNFIQFVFRKSPLTASIPYQLVNIYKICGLFSVESSYLKKLISTDNTPISHSESIEQLKLLELGFPLKACVSNSDVPSVNLREDLVEVIKILQTDKYQQKLLSMILG